MYLFAKFRLHPYQEDRENVLRARASGKGVLTAPFELLKTKRLGVILTFAVYKTDLPSNATPKERIQATDGYDFGQLKSSELVWELILKLIEIQKQGRCLKIVSCMERKINVCKFYVVRISSKLCSSIRLENIECHCDDKYN